MIGYGLIAGAPIAMTATKAPIATLAGAAGFTAGQIDEDDTATVPATVTITLPAGKTLPEALEP